MTEPPPREMLLNFTNLGVTAKLSGPSGLVWVTRLSDGAPQPGADVTIRDAKGKVRWHGTTDADGLAVTPGHAQLLPKHKRAQRNRAAGGDDDVRAGDGEEGGFEEGDFAGARSADVLVFARLGKDTTWVNPERTGGLAAWNFHVPVDTSARAEQLRGFLHTDRGLYRPGDTVRVKGLARVMKLGSRVARSFGAQGARHRARSARRAAAGEERSAQPLRRLRDRRAAGGGRTARRLPGRGVDARRCRSTSASPSSSTAPPASR